MTLLSAMDSSILLQDCLYGDCAVIVMNYMYNNNKITLIDTLLPRICCINISLNKYSLYSNCCYMPCDNNSVACLQTYEDVLAKISVICDKCNTEYVCIASDLNT